MIAVVLKDLLCGPFDDGIPQVSFTLISPQESVVSMEDRSVGTPGAFLSSDADHTDYRQIPSRSFLYLQRVTSFCSLRQNKSELDDHGGTSWIVSRF